jgi:tRNA dimethylallyltransferase
LAGWLGGEIVNCDSVQLYRFLDIGTAKTPPEHRRGIRHHLVDILNPDEVFTAGDYQRLGRAALADVAARGHVPVIVGGTGFYLRALLDGLVAGPSRVGAVRERLAGRKPGSLHRLLTRFDAEAAARIHPNDTQKLIRAVEVRLATGKPLSTLHQQAPEPLDGFRVLKIGLDPPRDSLARILDERCARMFANGIVNEVRQILAMGYPPDSKALESIGYRESMQVIEGVIDEAEALELTRAATRQYAKRQRTWFRREADVRWIHDFGIQPETVEAAKRHVESVRIP